MDYYERRGTIVVVVERRHHADVQPSGLIRALRRRVIDVRVVEAEAQAVRVGDGADWLEVADLVVLRGHSVQALTLARCAEAAGVPIVNAIASIEAVHNKAALALALAREGIECPSTLVGSIHELAQELRPEEYPVLLKPVVGDKAGGMRMVKSQRDMRRIGWTNTVALAQGFVPFDGHDLRLYVIGSRVSAVRKPSPFGPGGQAAQGGRTVPHPVTLALRELALRCGRLFGLEMYSVDCVEGPYGPVVIGVDEFPDYIGSPGADELMAEHVLDLASHAAVLQHTSR